MPEEITPGQILEALNDKADRDLMNVATGADVVVEYQMPNANNNYTWYRKYASGWVEQGGLAILGFSANADTSITPALPITMADTSYFADVTGNIDVPNVAWVICHSASHSTTTCIIWGHSLGGNITGTTRNLYWQVKGMAATVSE